MENKKSLLNKKIEVGELEKTTKIITLKALKVIAANGCKFAFEILEGKKPDYLEDLTQEVSLQIILNDYIITKECFKIVRKYIYNLEKDAIILNIIDSEEQSDSDIIDQKAYAEYITKYQEIKKSCTFDIESLGLTSRQLEIINMYSKLNSMGEVAKVLGVSKSTVSNTIYRLRDSLQYLQTA